MPNASLNVLFLSGEEKESDGSRIYRCVYQAKQIEQAGGRARVFHVGDFPNAELEAAQLVVFSRCMWGAAASRAIRAARRLDKLVCADLDDRIYAPWDADQTGAFRSKRLLNIDAGLHARAIGVQHDVLRLLPCFDRVLTSTHSIRDELELLGVPASVAPNAIDTSTRTPRARVRERLRRILFMTGTRTHDADFQLPRSGLLRFLLERRDVQLTLLGPIAAPAELLALEQVRRVDKLPLRELDAFVSEHDVCLVPLEPTPFNDCKSALKFVECGLVSVPVIASPRREYVAAIRDRENGLFADGLDGWYAALCALHADPELLRRIAAGAHQSVLAEHTVLSRRSRLTEQLTALLQAARPARSTVPPGLAVFSELAA